MEYDGNEETHIDLTKGNDTIVSISDTSDSETTETSDDTKWKCENCQLLNPEQVCILYIPLTKQEIEVIFGRKFFKYVLENDPPMKVIHTVVVIFFSFPTL